MPNGNGTQAILMAAGVGSRLSAYTSKPKSALSVSGSHGQESTIIEHTLAMMGERDIKVNLVVGYRKDNVKQMLASYPIRYFDNPFYRITNSIASLWFARDALVEAHEAGQDVILGNADVFWGVGLMEKVLATDVENMLLADRTRVEVGDYFFNVDDEGTLLAYGKDLAVEQRNCEYVGIGKLRADFIPTFVDHLDKLIWAESYNMWWEDALYRFKDETPVHVVDVEGLFWGEVDTIEDYQRIVDFIAAHPEELA